MKKPRIIALALWAAASLSATAQQHADPADLSFGENLEQPKPAKKGIEDIRSHMQSLEASLIKKGLAASLERNGEVLVATIPCSDLFAPNATELKPAAEKKLSPFLAFMKYPTMYKVLIAAYADDTGDNIYSDSITSARANAIFDYMTEASGQPGNNVVPYGLGREDPIMPNNSMRGRAANRRIEIYVVPEWQMLEMATSGKLKN